MLLGCCLSSQQRLWQGVGENERPEGEQKEKKSLRETPKTLKSLKTAKFRDFRTQRYQGFSKTHDFAGEAFSLRFRFARVRGAAGRGSKIWKTPRLR
jgi:hypothetical protein